MTLRKRMLLSVGGLTGLLLILLQALSLYGARNLSRGSLRQTSLLLARYQAEKVHSSLTFAETSSEAVLRTVELSHLLEDRAKLDAYLNEIIAGNPQISALELHPPQGRPIVLRRTAQGRLVQTDPMYGEEQVRQRSLQEQIEGAWVVSGRRREIAKAYHVQSRDGVRLFIEIPFYLLSEPLESTEGKAYGFLATDRKLYFDARQAGLEENQEWNDFSNEVLLGPFSGQGFSVRSDPIHHRPAWVGIAQVGDLPLKAGVVYLESDQFDLVGELIWWNLGLSLLGTALILVVTNLLTVGIVSPIEQFCAKVDDAAETDFKERIDLAPGAPSEVVTLARSFNRLMEDIQSHIAELESAVTQRQAMESELAIAARIQDSILPDFPFQTEYLEACGTSLPAREVGGDFLGIFPVGQDRVGFFLGDVSGKGVPAAIYMAFTASLLEHLGRLDVSPQEAIEIVNQALCARQEPSMFATVFFGILHRDGTLRYCNAGHHPPLILRPDGTSRELRVQSGLGVGIFESFCYGESEFELRPDDLLMLYTDGLTEAMNPGKEEFGEERLQDCLREHGEESLARVLECIQETLLKFRDGAEPNDDLTILLLKRWRGHEEC